MSLKTDIFCIFVQVFIVYQDSAKTSGNCGNIYIRKGIILRNTTTEWFEKYPKCLQETPRLEKVDARNINMTLYDLITHLPSNRSRELKYIYVRSSGISVIYGDAFGTLANIRKISFENNHIRILQEKAFFNLLSLRYIDLSGNELVNVNSSVFVNLPQLEILFLYDNRLKYIADDAFMTVASECEIFRIDIHNNDLNDLPYRSLINTSVTEINAKGNNITEITEDISLLQALGTLEVQNNCLYHVSTSLALLPSLDYIYLNDNNLTTLDKNMFHLLYRSVGINGIQLGGNPWRCDCKLYWMIQLVQMYNVTDNIMCNEPDHRRMLSFELDNLVCNYNEKTILTEGLEHLHIVNPNASGNESYRSFQSTQNDNLESLSDDKDFQSYDSLPKQMMVIMIVVCTLATLVVSAVCMVCLWRKKFGNRQKHVKMIANRHYYRPPSAGNRQYYSRQSVVDSSAVSVSPNRLTNTRYKTEKDKMGLGFTDLAIYGRLKLERLLGRGAFGEVYEGFDADFNNTGRKVAVKRLKDNASPEEMETLMKECETLTKIGSHPNIIEVYGISVINGSNAIVMELAEHGDLRDFLRKYYSTNRRAIINLDRSEEKSYLTSQCPRLFLFMWHIAKGMEYLSNVKILHRDLAARNILLAKGPIAKISDFGLSRDVYESGYYYQESGGRLPYKWMSPETLVNGKYTTESDVWSYGILVWEVVTLGSSPFPGIPPDMLISMHNSGYVMPQPSLCPNNIYSIMVDCWKYVPEQRTNFKTLVKDLDEIIERGSKQTYIDLSEALSIASSSMDED